MSEIESLKNKSERKKDMELKRKKAVYRELRKMGVDSQSASIAMHFGKNRLANLYIELELENDKN